MSVAGAVCYGIFNVLNKKKGLDQILCTAVYFTVTAWAGMLWLGVIIDALATFAWGRALQLSEVGILSNLAYLTPVVAALLSYVAIGEPIAPYSVVGMLLVLGGSLLQVIKIR